MSDNKPEEPKPVPELSEEQAKQVATNRESKDTPGQRLTAWRKPHNLRAYYGPPPHTYLNLKERPSEDNASSAKNDEEGVVLPTPLENGYSVPAYRPPHWVPNHEISGPTRTLDSDQGATTHPGPTLSAVKEGKVAAVCDPHLQILCGPLLKYDTVKDGYWYGAVMIVTNDNESEYHPFPTLFVEWESEDEKAVRRESDNNQAATQLDTEAGAKMEDPAQGNSSYGAGSGQADGTSASVARSSSSSSPTSPTEYVDSGDDSDTPPSDMDASGEEVSHDGSHSKHKKSVSTSAATWASSMMRRLKDLGPQRPSFRGRPSERILRTEKERQEAQEWATKRLIEGEPIYKYTGAATTATFWRFMLEIPVNPDPTKGLRVTYAINKPKKPPVDLHLGQHPGADPQRLSTDITFHIAPTGSDMRFAAYSCNGFSDGIDPDIFKGEGFDSGFDPVWADLLQHHEERPFHALMGGGDQIYCDPLTKEPELVEYMKLKTNSEKIGYPLTDSIAFAIDRFYFNHYCLVFRNGCFAKAISQIPMVNMLDDHDLIDGFGSYPEGLQRSTLFKQIGARGYFFFLLFQCFTVDTVDGTLVEPGQHTFKSMIIGEDGPYIPFPSHSSLHWFGAKTWLLMLDCRAERRKDLILTPKTYEHVFAILRELPDDVEHLIIQLGIPISYPRMNLAERMIHSDGILAKVTHSGFFGSFANKFNKDMELLDDLSDHWTASNHKRERNWFILQLQALALERKLRISFVSGDVHLAAVGCFKTYPGKRKKTEKGKGVIQPPFDHRYMVNIVSSAIVNTPPPPPAQATLNMLAGHKHRTLHYYHTDEVMLPVFQEGLRTDTRHLNYVAGARNYTIGERDPSTGEFVFDVRVERRTGQGETKGYVVRIPPPQWEPSVADGHSLVHPEHAKHRHIGHPHHNEKEFDKAVNRQS
ncbi:hypothetical protein FRC19_006026 [Serendipita sp. 401]|nr:hypothetical protein FRC19_006026 [Serendipita sp. 401]